SELFEDGSFTIHDIHHVHKKDSPSGTALSWKEWLDRPAQISADRKGDVVGYHHLKFDCRDEAITLVHEAKDRSIFARGALWAAKILHEQNDLDYGLLDFNQVVKKTLNI
ncbi:MAG: dihydrodipicolinate reductase C-terminal domain-containing protein, partial [Bacteriovoracaceae bacterium]